MRSKFVVIAAVLAACSVMSGVAEAASSPGVSTGSASNVADNSAVLHALVNPNGESTTYYFQWGLTTAYGSAGRVHSAGKGLHAVAVTATATNLVPGTTYHYHLVATNRSRTSIGTDRSFKTGGHPPPGAATGPATSIGKFRATPTGTVTTNGETTAWLFQYGLTAAYGMETFGATVPASVPSATVSEPLSGLQPGAIFHFRLVAIHSNAPPSYGADQTFMTLPYPRLRPRVGAVTTPRADRKKPFAFTTFGSVTGPFPAALQCYGNATIRYILGRRQVAVALAAVQPNCTFAARVVFHRVPGRGRRSRIAILRVLVRFNGNGYLTPRSARSGTVTIR
jgi:hypothetical protein